MRPSWMARRRTGIASLALALALGACAAARPVGWTREGISQIVVRGNPPRVLSTRVLSEPGDLGVMVDCMGRAQLVDPADWFRGTHSIDVHGSTRAAGPWVYDSRTGQFTLLAHNRKPTYRLDEACRAEVERRFLPTTRDGG